MALFANEQMLNDAKRWQRFQSAATIDTELTNQFARPTVSWANTDDNYKVTKRARNQQGSRWGSLEYRTEDHISRWQQRWRIL